MDLKAIVFDIQKFSLHDGPGIRTTVFLKGCPLRCLWCHNPESWAAQPELLYAAGKCTGCGKCAAVCSNGAHSFEAGKHIFSRNLCQACGKCADVCPMEALELCGRYRTIADVMAEVMTDLPFYQNSGGGMTLSGGEPMAQSAFAEALLRTASANGIHTALETCGFASWQEFQKILPFTDLFLFDIKSLDAEKHRKFTGVPLAPILRTLDALAAAGANIILRCPLIPGMNDSQQELSGIGELAEKLPAVSEVQLEPYHSMGQSKALRLGMSDYYAAPFATQEFTQACITEIQRHTAKNVRKS
jgi:glycyl-radical enzyme activating protein